MEKRKLKTKIDLLNGVKINKYLQAKKVTGIWNAIGILVGLWVFLYPVPYIPLIIFCAFLPLIGIYLMAHYKEEVTFDQIQDSSRPSVVYLMALSSMSLCFRGYFDHNIIHSTVFWWYLAVFSIFLYLFILIVTSEYKRHKLVLLELLLILIPYCYGLISLSNCMLDFSGPKSFSPIIIDKRVVTGKSISYYIDVSPWGPYKEQSEISVTKDIYDNLSKNGKVNLQLKKGALGIRWFYIDDGKVINNSK